MISRGSWRLSRKCANGKRRRRLVRSPARRRGRPEPRNQIQKAGGAQRPGRPRARGWRRGGRRASGSPARGGAAAAAQVRSRLSPTWRGGGSLEATGAPGRAVEQRAVPGAALGSREGGWAGPEAISFVQVMKAASRAPGPRCRRRRGERELLVQHRRAAAVSVSCAPRAAQRRPAPLPRRASLSLPPRLARSLAPRLPGSAPSSRGGL